MTNPSSITVRDNTGRAYTARILQPGDTYGNGAVWGERFYQSPVGITIDGTPATYNASQIASYGHDHGQTLAIDSGADWRLDEESTAAFFKLAVDALAPKPPRYRGSDVVRPCPKAKS